MANLTESPIYETGIFQLEKSTPAVGGAPVIDNGVPSAGHANAQGLQLANRTAWLRQEVNALSQVAKLITNYTALRAYTGNSGTVSITDAGTKGLFFYDANDTTSLDNAGTVIVDSSGRRWKRSYSGPIDLRWFGAIADDTTDSSDAIESALKLNQPILVIGFYVATKRFIATGSQWLCGFGKESSRIRWPSTAASAGIRVTPLSLDDLIYYKDLELRCETPNGAGEAFVYSSWSGLTNYTTVTYFSTKFRMEGCTLRCVGTGVFTKGVEVRQLFGSVIQDNNIYGASKVLFNDIPAAFPTTHGIHASNDGTRNSDVQKFYDNHIYYAVTAVWIDDVEGVEFENNDMQVCWNGLWIVNTLVKTNQFRVSGGHYGVANTAIYIKNSRHAFIHGADLSWGSNRANGAAITYVILESCLNARFTNNTIRGNAATTTYGHTITGLQLTGVAGDLTSYPIVDENTWDYLTVACAQELYTSNLVFGLANTFVNVGTRLLNNLGAGSAPRIIYGSGPHQNPTATGPQVLLTSIQQSPLALNRQGNNGTIMTFHVDNAAMSGSISAGATSVAYNTTSDMTLKEDLGELDPLEAMETLTSIIVRKYTWKVNGAISEGVFAQELYEVFPDAVFKGYWFKLNEDGSEEICDESDENALYVPWSVDYSKLVPILISGIQCINEKASNFDERLKSLEMKGLDDAINK